MSLHRFAGGEIDRSSGVFEIAVLDGEAVAAAVSRREDPLIELIVDVRGDDVDIPTLLNRFESIATARFEIGR